MLGCQTGYPRERVQPKSTMGKKVKHPEHENLERWLVSYADFITLLFATFTALYAIATAELSKMSDVSEAISQSFEQQSLMHGIDSLFEGKSTNTEKHNAAVINTGQGEGVLGQHDSTTFTPSEVKAMEEMVDELQTVVAQLNAEIEAANEAAAAAAETNPDEPANAEDVPIAGIEVSVQDRGIKISFDSRLLFAPGSAQLSPQCARLIDRVLKRIKSYAVMHQMHVEGHTDSQPLTTALYPSNWELSTARASTVVRHMIRLGFDPHYLVAVGYADSRPEGDNNTATGRAKNRRIDLILYSKKEGLATDPSKQHRRERTLIKDTTQKSPTTKPLGKSPATPTTTVEPSAPIVKDAVLKSIGNE
jgi:chemotaxis protein MotB